MKDNYFVYRTEPFRPLYLGGYFNVPHKLSRLWLFGDRNVAKRIAAMNGAACADFRDYIRIAQGASAPERRSVDTKRKTPPTLDDLA